jgi:hypothetical protein
LGGHAGKFGYTAEGELAPSSAGVGGSEGLGECYRFAAERCQVLIESAVHVLALRLQFTELEFETF